MVFFSSNMVLISLYIKRHNKGKEVICKYINQHCGAYSRAKCGIEKQKGAPNVHHSATKCADLLFVFFEMNAIKTQKLQNLNCKIDHDVYCCSFKVICDFQYPQSPLEVPPVGNLGHLTTFYPFLTTFPSSRFLSGSDLTLRKTFFIKINKQNTLFTNDKVCFLFNNTDSHISRLTTNFIFQSFEKTKEIIIIFIIPYCISLTPSVY